MSWSLGEIRSLSVKAARGVGLEWGIAEEAGFAVEWLEAHGIHGAKALAQYLSKVHREENFVLKNCPLHLGCHISDVDDWSAFKGARIYQPVLTIPFMINTLQDRIISMSWDTKNITIQKDGISIISNDEIVSEPCKLVHSISIKPIQNTIDLVQCKSRVLEDETAYIAILNALAHETYAPATEASRIAGAGAGLNDND